MTILNLMRMPKSSQKGYKTLWGEEKLLVTSNFSFSNSVFKRLVLQTHKNKGLFGKGLNTISKQKHFLCRNRTKRTKFHACFDIGCFNYADSVHQRSDCTFCAIWSLIYTGYNSNNSCERYFFHAMKTFVNYGKKDKSLKENCGKKEKTLVTSIFSFSQNVIKEKLQHLSHNEIVVCKWYQICKGLNFVIL